METWRRWLQQVWAHAEFAAAVEVASPVLARQVRDVCDRRRQQPRQVRRVVVSILRYLLRATSRATPFGLFAGVAPLRFGDELVARFGEEHRAVARVDAAWLEDVITQLEGCAPLRRRLPVMVNSLCFVRDGRLVVGCQQQTGSADGNAPAEVSVRRTRAVQTVVQTTRSPIRVGDLVSKLAAEFPETPESVIEGMLAELVARRILITNLRPPMTTTEPLVHVIEELTAVGTDEVPEAAQLLCKLRDIYTELDRHNRACSPTHARDLRIAASGPMRSLSMMDMERPIAVDLRLDCRVALPQSVAAEAEHAAAALARLTPHRTGTPAWQDYHSRFLERYGIGTLVPLSELLNPDSGLGFPAGYRDSRLPPPTLGLSDRDAALLALAQKAAIEQRIGVVLDDQAIMDLAVSNTTTAQPAPHTELRFRVHAPTMGALERGDFELALTGVSRAAGTTAGRFLDLFDTADRERMSSAYAQLPTVCEDAVPAQVSAPALYPRAENVTRTPATCAHLVSFAEHRTPGGNMIGLDDLAVTGDAHRLYVMSLSRRRAVEPVVFSAVEFTRSAHPLLRFLAEITTARSAACAPFSWGAAARLPFVPRVTYRRTILSPARWILAGTDLPGPAATWPNWTASLMAWRRRWRVTDAVYLGEDDRRIRLDLNEPSHQHLLRLEAERTGYATVREAPSDAAFGWFGGRAHDVVVPLAVSCPADRSPAGPSVRRACTVDREHGHLPGEGDWLYAKFYGAEKRQATILTTHLPRLLAAWDTPPEWWFLRYRDPEPHLRLRIRLRAAEEFGDTAMHVCAWAKELRRLGLLGKLQLDTYHPEIGRFGAGAAMVAAESVFVTDSAAAIAQLAHADRSGAAHQHALIAASLVELAISFIGDIGEGMSWLIEHLHTTSVPAPGHEVRDQAIRLATPYVGWGVVSAIPGGKAIASTWQRRREKVRAYRNALIASGGATPEAVLGDLLHLHHVRMAGIDPDTERACGHLARAAALSWSSRPRGAQ